MRPPGRQPGSRRSKSKWTLRKACCNDQLPGINFNSDGESGQFDLHAVLDSLVIEDVQDEPLKNMSLVVNGSFPDLETIKLDSSKLTIPELMTQVLLNGQIDSLSGNLVARFDGDLLSIVTAHLFFFFKFFKFRG